MRAAGFNQNREAVVAKAISSAAGNFFATAVRRRSIRPMVVLSFEFLILSWKRRGLPFHFRENFRESFLFPFGEGIGGVAVGATEVAGGEADENARQPGESASPCRLR